MSHYDEVLKEARAKASGTAKEYVPRLFHILVDEENRKPDEARAIIEHDLISYWAKATVTKYLPREAKDETKVKAGEEGAKATNLVLTTGENVTTPADGVIPAEPPKDPSPPPPPEPPENPLEIEIQFLKEQVAELQDALKKTEQFLPANQLTEKQARDMTMEAVKQAGLAVPQFSEEGIFQWLEKRDNGVNCYWYPNYGIELFRNRILTQLKNKGVTTFKRLYFEI